MKLRIIAGALLIFIFSSAISIDASAGPWRHCRGGWCGPRVGVSVGIPVPPVPVPPVVVGGGYYGPAYYGGYYSHPHYGRGYAYGGHWGGYRGGYHGGYGHYGHRR